MDDKKRITYIDLAKGIGIALIVLGHAYTKSSFLVTLVYSFHIPLFFIVSGILFDEEKDISAQWLLKKCKKLLLPYIIWGAVFQLYLLLLNMLGGASFGDHIGTYVKTYLMLSSGAMWFLPIMFIASILHAFAKKKNQPLCIILAIVLCALCMLFKTDNQVLGYLLRSGMGYFFLCVGSYGKCLFKTKAAWWKICIVLIVDLALVYINGTVSLAGIEFGNLILYIISSVSGSWLLIQLCLYICDTHLRTGIVEKWGRFSIIILCTHQVFFQEFCLE